VPRSASRSSFAGGFYFNVCTPRREFAWSQSRARRRRVVNSEQSCHCSFNKCADVFRRNRLLRTCPRFSPRRRWHHEAIHHTREPVRRAKTAAIFSPNLGASIRGFTSANTLRSNAYASIRRNARRLDRDAHRRCDYSPLANGNGRAERDCRNSNQRASRRGWRRAVLLPADDARCSALAWPSVRAFAFAAVQAESVAAFPNAQQIAGYDRRFAVTRGSASEVTRAERAD
jgi:hypothetical protein